MIVARELFGESMLPRIQGRPPFRADHVGSLLRPTALRQAFRQHAAGEITDDAFAAVQDRCIRDAVALQEQTGLQVVTDGEFRRGSYWGRFAERTEGLEIRPASFKFRDDAGDEIEFTGPYAKAKIGRRQALAVDEFIFLHGATKVTAKITLPAPSTMHFFRFDDFADRAVYSDAEAFFADLTQVFQQEFAALTDAGCAVYN
jgi:5-methyltetrahydropteroyltriglutamate--homocysteine methyltransferase